MDLNMESLIYKVEALYPMTEYSKYKFEYYFTSMQHLKISCIKTLKAKINIKFVGF